MQVYIGIDWSEKKHDAVFINAAGAVLAVVTFEHSLGGLEKFEAVILFVRKPIFCTERDDQDMFGAKGEMVHRIGELSVTMELAPQILCASGGRCTTLGRYNRCQDGGGRH